MAQAEDFKFGVHVDHSKSHLYGRQIVCGKGRSYCQSVT